METIISEFTELKLLQIQLATFCHSLRLSRKNKKVMKDLIQRLQVQTHSLNEEILGIQIMLEARDLCIQSLGEKLSILREQNSEPFFVGNKSDPSVPSEGPALLRHGSEAHWTDDKTNAHQNEMLHEMARLSLLPMGIDTDSSSFGDMTEALAKSLRDELELTESENSTSDESEASTISTEVEAEYLVVAEENDIISRTVHVIEKAEEHNVSRLRTIGFLRSKHITETEIAGAYNMFDQHKRFVTEGEREYE